MLNLKQNKIKNIHKHKVLQQHTKLWITIISSRNCVEEYKKCMIILVCIS